MLYQNNINTFNPSIADSSDYQTSGTLTPESTEYPRPPFIDEHSVVLDIAKRKPGDSLMSTGGESFKVQEVKPKEEHPTEASKQTIQAISDQMSGRSFWVWRPIDRPEYDFFLPDSPFSSDSRYAIIRTKRNLRDPLQGLGFKCSGVHHHHLAESLNIAGTLQAVKRRIGKDWAEPLQLSVAKWDDNPPTGPVSFKVTSVSQSSCPEVPYDEDRLRPFRHNLEESEWIYSRGTHDDNEGAYATLTRKVPGSGAGVINTFGVDKAFARSVEMGERHHPDEYIEGGIWPLQYAQ